MSESKGKRRKSPMSLCAVGDSGGMEVNMYSNGCIICGKDLIYFSSAKWIKCSICGKEFETNASCIEGHFVCDMCHSQPALLSITACALTTGSKSPVTIAVNMMKEKSINMHGPEHHYLIVASLLSAYKNSGGDIDLEKALLMARQRSINVPGGICGMWGSCGAGIGAGMFVSIITEATPLSVEEWGNANLATSKSLYDIAKNGGPRCCKRNTLLSIMSAIDTAKDITGIQMEKPGSIKCSFFIKNPTCKKEKCPYYPMKTSLQ